MNNIRKTKRRKNVNKKMRKNKGGWRVDTSSIPKDRLRTVTQLSRPKSRSRSRPKSRSRRK